MTEDHPSPNSLEKVCELGECRVVQFSKLGELGIIGKQVTFLLEIYFTVNMCALAFFVDTSHPVLLSMTRRRCLHAIAN